MIDLTQISEKNLIGKRVRSIRKSKKLTQKDLAGALQLLGVMIDRMSINRIESGTRCVNDYELVALSEVLGVSINWLLFGEEEVPTR